MSIYSGVRLLRLEKHAESVGDMSFKMIQELAKPTLGAMGQKGRTALQEARFKLLTSEYKSVFQRAVNQDPLLKEYGDKVSLQEAYKVMIKFAPTLALEPLVARSFLRMFIQGDGVIPEQQIERLSKAESQYTNAK